MIDAMFTTFVPRNGMDRYQMHQVLFKKHTGRDFSAAEVKGAYDTNRARWEHLLPPNHSEKWAIIDREIVRALCPDILFDEADRIGKTISIELLTNPELWNVEEDTRQFLSLAPEFEARVVIASNQDADKLRTLIDHFGLGPQLSGIYTSTELGVEKPDPGFFRAVLEREKTYKTCSYMIGNNPDNDMAGARDAGIFGVLYDPHEKYPEYRGARIKRLSEFWRLGGLFFYTT